MIKVENLCKNFDDFAALQGLNLHVRKGSIYGLIGVNGSGKTTVIKHLTGVVKADFGKVTIDGEDVYENETLKERMGYIPDELYFFGNYSIKAMASFYRQIYPRWNQQRFEEMLARFGLPANKRIANFSKGMQKQAMLILQMSIMPDFMILDEPIDGLDPLIRKTVWEYIVADVADRQMTVLVSSHNLREMEGFCDSIGILSGGKMFIEKDLDELTGDIHKIQVLFPAGVNAEEVVKDLHVLHHESRGSIEIYIIRGKADEVEKVFTEYSPRLYEMIPLSLEEVFIYEMGGANHDIKAILE